MTRFSPDEIESPDDHEYESFEDTEMNDMGDNIGTQSDSQAMPPWLAELQATIQQQAARIAELEGYAAAYAGNTTANSSEQLKKRPKHKLKDPEPYDDTDRSLYPQFRSKIEAKLTIDAEAIGDESERVWYGFNLLQGAAAARVHPWIEVYQREPTKFIVTEFLKQMDLAFLDTEMQEKALAKLNNLRQGNRSFDDLLTELDRLLLEAGGHGWEDRVKKAFIKAALNQSLRERLIAVSEKPVYEEYCHQVKEVADRLAEYQRIGNSKKGLSGAARPNSIISKDATITSTTTPDSDVMDWEPLTSRTQKRRAKWVSQEELDKRRREKRCLRCGAKHWLNQCPFLPAIPPKPLQPKPKVSSVDIEGAELEDEEPNSGKE